MKKLSESQIEQIQRATEEIQEELRRHFYDEYKKMEG